MIDENLLQAFLTLMLCVVGLGVVLFLVKRYSAKLAPQKQTIDMKIIGRLSLQKANVYTIQVGNRTLLIGTTDHSITTLADISSTISASLPAANSVSSLSITQENPIVLPPKESLSFGTFLHSISHRQKN